MNQTRFPRRIEVDLSTQTVGEETLVYDEKRHIAFCLDRVASAVWRHSDGSHSVSEISESTSLSEDHVVFALAQLQRDGLLQAADDSFVEAGILSRRRLLGTMGTAALLLPVVAVMTAPAAAQYNGCADCSTAPQAPKPVQPAAPQPAASTSSNLFKP